MIHEVLGRGRENAKTGRELATLLNRNIRDITAQIEEERRAGYAICASCAGRPGYYLADDPDDLRAYCDQLKGRGIQVLKTRQALMNILRETEGRQRQEAGT